MTTLVLDASVAAKWMLPAQNVPLRPEAFRLLDQYAHGKIHFIVPDIFWAECGNILWKAVRQKRLSQLHAEKALDLLIRRNFVTVPSSQRLADAFQIALQYGHAVYDALYIATAIDSKSHMITADERLAQAAGAYLPVKWLGAFPLV